MRRRAREITRKALNDTLGGATQSISQRLTWTGTFHSIGNRLLRHYAPHVKLDPHFSVIDRADAADLMDSVRQELGFAELPQRFPRKETCLQIYSNRVNTRCALRQTLDSVSRLSSFDRQGTQINVAVQNNLNVEVKVIADRLIKAFDHEPDVKARIAQALLEVDDEEAA